MVEFRIPELGEGIESAEVVAVLVEAGQELEPGAGVVELETGKAVVELPCPTGGTVSAVRVRSGQTVVPGQVVLELAEEAGPESPVPRPSQRRASSSGAEGSASSSGAPLPPEAAAPEVSPARPVRAPSAPIPAGPATRKLARELGVDLAEVRGSASGGRITGDDVRAFVKSALRGPAQAAAPAPPVPDFTRWGEVERVPMSTIRTVTARNMTRAWQQVPQVTHHDLADVTELEAARKRYNASGGDARVTMTALLLKALVAAVRARPRFNASVDGDTLVVKRYLHVGVAVDTPHGLLVPVIRDVDHKSVLQLAAELSELSARARERALTLDEMTGATITLSNLGGIGGTSFTPIVNWPEVAILGISRAAWHYRPGPEGPEARLLMPLSLTYDHRAVDGADAARFTRHVAEVVGDPMRLLLEG